MNEVEQMMVTQFCEYANKLNNLRVPDTRIAQHLGLSQTMFSRIRNHKRTVSEDLIQRIETLYLSVASFERAGVEHTTQQNSSQILAQNLREVFIQQCEELQTCNYLQLFIHLTNYLRIPQYLVADYLEVHSQYISQYVSGRMKAPDRLQVKILDFLDSLPENLPSEVYSIVEQIRQQSNDGRN